LCALVLPAVANGQQTTVYALVEGSTFQRGCFDPCECPIGQEQPLSGTFSLTFVSQNPLFADYAMNDVRWKIDGSSYATPPNALITGSGTYSIGGEFAIEQQMQADLTIAGEPPAHFDSGRVVGGGGFPEEIDVEISKSGKYCFDTVMHVVARELPADCAATYCPEPGPAASFAAGAAALALLQRRRKA
jgi:uncharacterized protein (TIGR03382 family)